MSPRALPALWHSRAGIVASGTATVEAAMMHTPFVMVYRVSPLTYFLGKPRVKVPYFAMVNLIAGEQVVPELVQHDFTADNVVAQMKEILPDGPARSYAERLGRSKAPASSPGKIPERAAAPADRGAEIILNLQYWSSVQTVKAKRVNRCHNLVLPASFRGESSS